MNFVTVTAQSASASVQPPSGIPANGFLWCDCPYDEVRAWVEPIQRLTGVTFFEDHLIDAENPYHPSYFDSTQRYEMIVFRGLAIAPPEGGPNQAIRVKTTPTVFFITPGCLVTVRPPDSRLVPALRDRLLTASEAHQRLPGGPEELMLRLLNGMVDRYLDLRQPLTDQLERWQKALLDPRRPFRDWYVLLEARSEARKLEQLCEEQLDALQEWRDERLEHISLEAQCPPGALPSLSDSLEVRANDLVEHIHRVLNHARRLESSVESAVQLHFSATAHRTNDIMRTLTTITAIFMPLNLITGIYGMNFEMIPGLKSPIGFWMTIGAMLLITLGLMIFFRAQRYLASAKTTRMQQRRTIEKRSST